MKRILEKTIGYDPEKRKDLIVGLLAQQRECWENNDNKIAYADLWNHDEWTLLNLRNGLIKGSNLCPHCDGFLGRADEFYE